MLLPVTFLRALAIAGKKPATVKYPGAASTLLNVRIKREHTAHSDCEAC